ncbi:MAG: hypothetical protein K5912_03670 [Alphaproteobacteria bacterium]|nr:hypothetical protein [Alphaproteobacteria bacterium]
MFESNITDPTLVVSSAFNTFNNGALATPAFFWGALLCLPLFLAVYYFGKSSVAKMLVKKYVSTERVCFWAAGLTALWLVLMGGNYAVLRDSKGVELTVMHLVQKITTINLAFSVNNVSLLPWVTAFALFIVCVFVGAKTRSIKLPLWYGKADISRRRKWFINILVGLLVLLLVAISGCMTWWTSLIQVGAVLLGVFLGRRIIRKIHFLPYTLLVFGAVVVGLLMQPEYFRFAQLGNLTLIHLLWLLLTGGTIVAALATNIVNARGRVHDSAYIKLKWLARFLTLLCVVLFVLTESVPMFLTSLLFAFALFGLSVWHGKENQHALSESLFGWAVIFFGVTINVPTITVLGILLLCVHQFNFKAAKFLL